MPLLRNIFGAVVGSAIDRRDGKGGAAGAVAGMVATRIAMRSLPGALLVGGALVAKRIFDRRRAARGPTAKP